MKVAKKALAILVGSLLLAIGINLFLVPFKVLDGGVIGLGLILHYITGVKAGLAIIFLSVPIFVIAWIFNKAYFFNSLHGMLFSSFIIDIMATRNLFSKLGLAPILSSVIGGVFVGLGIGIMLRQETSTGGTDLLAQFLSKILNVNVGIMIFIIDAVVISLGGLLISKETFFLSFITITFVGLSTTISTWNLPK
ncbi:YitT family protein [Fredinandcohnia sp. 179-A 10B2 NHS]|uniref:YitT family protein n=1 Tax=Fredinandcohnia sp. 179-A 10B2 NHS TaxID=3235176 RepID=UPI0039A0A570